MTAMCVCQVCKITLTRDKGEDFLCVCDNCRRKEEKR